MKRIVWRLFLTFVLATAACSLAPGSPLTPGESPTPAATSDSGKTIFFPRQKKSNGEWAAMDALTSGNLVLVDRCLRLERGESLANYLLIWPPDFDFSLEDGTIQILNGEGKIVASPGDRVQMSGGEIPFPAMLDKSIQAQVPPQCAGPYWIMGYEFNKVNPSK